MKPAGGSISRAWLGAIAVFGSALMIVGCGGTLTDSAPGTPESEPVGASDRSSGDELIADGSTHGARADAGADDPSPEDPEQAEDPCGRCGNGAIDCGENCDDGNEVTERCVDLRIHPNARLTNIRVCGDNCRWTACKLPRCGDEIVDPAANEQCDEGQATRTCTAGCKFTECGQTANLEDFSDDYDCDGAVDDQDNCPKRHNPDQADADQNGTGDACEPGECYANLCGTPQQSGCGAGDGSILLRVLEYGDTYKYGFDFDGDGSVDGFDNCPLDANPDQADGDEDGVGDACDPQVCPSRCR